MKTVLIVEDEPIIQNGMEKILLSIDKTLQVIKTGYAKEALQIADQVPIDIFILDIQLMDYSGMELGEQIRGIDRYLLTPIIFITAIPTQEIIAFKKLHCYDYIVKPFSNKEAKEILEPIIKHTKAPDASQNVMFQLKHKGVTYKFRQDEIVYFEARNRHLFITTIHETAGFKNCSLSSVEIGLKKSFVRCHKGFIVNTDHVFKINHVDKEIVLRADCPAIPIGRKYALNLKEL